MTAVSTHLPRWAGLIAGLGLAAGILLHGKLPAEGQAGGARVSMLTQPPARLGISPIGVKFIDVRDLRPGAPQSGFVLVQNRLGEPLLVTVKGTPTTADLDDALRVDMRVAGVSRFSGTLRALRRWTGEFRLGGRKVVMVEFRIFFPEGQPAREHAGRSENVQIAWSARKAAVR